MKIPTIFYLKLFSFGGNVLNIFEQACFRNVTVQIALSVVVQYINMIFLHCCCFAAYLVVKIDY